MRRIGVDVGGTFTDVVLLDDRTRRVWSTKVPTTPLDPAEGALTGISRVLELSQSAPGDVGFIGHGTTIATNMIIEGEGAKTALLTTRGFRDILEIRRAWRHDRADLYDLFFTNPAPLVPRHMRREVRERVLFDGSVECRLEKSEVDECIEAFEETGIEAIAVCFINSHVNDAHERQALERIRERLADAFVTGSVEVNPEIMEYERTCTTVVNATLGPRCGQYAHKFTSNVRGAGLSADIYFMQSNGGLAKPETVAERPVTLLESGPAGGVTAAARLCERLEIPNAITGDMGGTSFDVSLIRDYRPELRNDTLIRTFTVRCPNIDIVSIGAGGGSIAWIDAGGGVRIGPESARADPGPVCYGRGGTRPTVTDCNLILGHVDQQGFLGGDFALDVEAAAEAVRLHLAEPLGVSVEAAALVVRQVANALMAQAIRLVTVERGYDPRDFIYVCYGGAGPVHAAELARELEIPTVVVPPMPGLFSAFGMLVADMMHDLQASVVQIVDEIDPSALEAKFGELEAKARSLMEEAGIDAASVEMLRRADCCYLGQGETIQVDVSAESIRRESLDRVVEAFVQAHRRQWNFDQPDRPIRLVNIRLRVVGKIGMFAEGARVERRGAARAEGTARIRFADGWREVSRYRRDQLKGGDRLQGPLVVEELSSRLAIEESDVLEVRDDGCITVTIGRA